MALGWCAESTPRPGDFGQPLNCSLVMVKQTRNLLVQLIDLLRLIKLALQDLQLVEPQSLAGSPLSPVPPTLV